jgi:hypothetical protein
MICATVTAVEKGIIMEKLYTMTLNELSKKALELIDQGYGDLEVCLNSEYHAIVIEHTKTRHNEYIDICGR